MTFSGNVGNGPTNKRLNFGADPDHRLDTGIVFRIRQHWEIRKVVSSDCAALRCVQIGYSGEARCIRTRVLRRPSASIYTMHCCNCNGLQHQRCASLSDNLTAIDCVYALRATRTKLRAVKVHRN